MNSRWGEEFEPIEYVVTQEMVNFLLIGINDRHPWYFEASPFGGPIAPPLMCEMANIRLRTWHMWGDFIGAVFTRPPSLSTMTMNGEAFARLSVRRHGRWIANSPVPLNGNKTRMSWII
ncbi:hypothetical protein ACFLT4_00360 [Chloroflexota bacterium]